MSKRVLHAYSAVLLAAGLAGALGVETESLASPHTRAVARATQKDFALVAGGDLLGPYRSDLKLDDPFFAKVVSIVRSADAAFANEEGSTFDFAEVAAGVHAGEGNALPPHSLATTRAFKAMGFNLFSRANNHSMDWGIEGMLATDKALDAIGIVHAGTGRSLEAARAPAYLNATKGRIALVASASFFPADFPAGDAGRGSIWPPDIPDHGSGPRPGLNPLRVRKVTLVSPEEMATLCQIRRVSQWPGVEFPCSTQLGDELGLGGISANLLWVLFRVSDKPGVTYEVSKTDRLGLIGSIATARRAADLVVYSIHAHEGRSGEAEGDEPADFLTPLFHDAVDAGADVVVRSGPHFLQGVEIYHGKPIFYGLGNLFLDFPYRFVTKGDEGWEPENPVTATFTPEWYESAIAASEFRNGALTQVTIYPLIIESRESLLRGYPRLAHGVDAQRILDRIRQHSRQFGTEINRVNDVGVIKAGATP